MDGDLFDELRARGHEVLVLSPFRTPTAGRVAGSVNVGRLPRFFLAIPGYLRMLRRGLRHARVPGTRIACQYQAFHAATTVAFLVSRLRGQPLLVRAHDPLPGSYRSRVENRINRFLFLLYRGILNHREAWVFVPSPELLDIVVQRLKLRRERLRVLPNNVTPFPAASPEAVRALRKHLRFDGSRVVLQFGSFTRTGIGTLVTAIKTLDRADVKGVVLADPDLGATFLREAERAGARDRLVVLASRPHAELGTFLAVADVCIGVLSAHPLARGSLPRSALEAMAVGKAVVLCRGVASSSLVADGRNCLLIPPDDPGALARAIGRLLDDRGLAAAIGERARETVRERFRSETVAERFETLVRDLLEPPRP